MPLAESPEGSPKPKRSHVASDSWKENSPPTAQLAAEALAGVDLTAEELAAFEEDGFLVLRDVVPAQECSAATTVNMPHWSPR